MGAAKERNGSMGFSLGKGNNNAITLLQIEQTIRCQQNNARHKQHDTRTFKTKQT